MNKKQEESINQLSQMSEIVMFKNKTQAFVHHIKMLDIEGVGSLLDDNVRFNDYSKKDFLLMMSNMFEGCKKMGVKKINAVMTSCKGCDKGMKGYGFYHKLIPSFFVLIIETKEGEITNVFRCSDPKRVYSLKVKSTISYCGSDTDFFNVFNDPF